MIKRVSEELLVAVRGLRARTPARCFRPASWSSGWRRRAIRCTTNGWGKLFEGNPDPVALIKWKEVYDNLEKTLDYGEDAANVLESISIKHG